MNLILLIELENKVKIELKILYTKESTLIDQYI